MSQIPDKRADESAGVSPVKLRRLYRGLTKPYNPGHGPGGRAAGTDFTNCPYTALNYASGPKGTVLILDVPEDSPDVREELWLNPKAKRFMIWGRFDEFIIAQLSAKELRAQVRQKGIITAFDEDKAYVLRRYIGDRHREMGLH